MMDRLIRLLFLNVQVPRRVYALWVPICLDVPFGACVRGYGWGRASFLALVLVCVTARRMLGIPWPRWWAIPYTVLSLSPCCAYLFARDADLLLVVLCMIALQVPVMVWKQETQKARVSVTGDETPK